MRWARIWLGVAATIGCAVGGVMLWIGFQLNQQGELFDPETGTVHFGYAFLIFASWFLASFAVLAASGGAFIAIGRLVKRLRANSGAAIR
jgi:hypothetical protein